MNNQLHESFRDSSFHELGVFVRNNPGHAVKLIENGVCEVVLQSLEKDGRKPHVAYQGSFALHSLAIYPSARIRLSRLPTCQLIMKLFKQHSKNTLVLKNICWLLRNLCSEYEARENFIQLHAHCTILEMSHECLISGRLQDVDQIFAPIMSLTAHPEVRKDFTETLTALDQLNKIILQSLQNHRNYTSELVMDIFGLIYNLCTFDTRCREMIQKSNIVHSIVEIISTRNSDRTLVELGFQTLSSISGSRCHSLTSSQLLSQSCVQNTTSQNIDRVLEDGNGGKDPGNSAVVTASTLTLPTVITLTMESVLACQQNCCGTSLFL